MVAPTKKGKRNNLQTDIWKMSARELMAQLKEYGWSFRDIEKELNISRSTLSRIRSSDHDTRANELHYRLLAGLVLRGPLER